MKPDVAGAVRNEAVFGSGLLSPWYFDWPPHLCRVLEDYDPDVVVFLFVGNYDLDTGRYWESADGDVIADPTSREFFTAWRRQAEQMGERAAEDERSATKTVPAYLAMYEALNARHVVLKARDVETTFGFRVKNEDEIAGIDTIVHGEEGYVLADTKA